MISKQKTMFNQRQKKRSQRIEFAIHKEVVEAFPCHHTHTLDKPVHSESPNIQNKSKTSASCASTQQRQHHASNVLARSVLYLGTSANSARLSLNLLTMLIPTLRKDLVKVVLAPSDIRAESRKLPHTVLLLVPVLVGAVCMSLHLDGLLALVCVPLVGYTQLVPADDFVVGHLLPLGATDEVLGAEGLVAEDGGGGGHGDEVVGGHGGPFFVEEGAVVDVDGLGDALAEAGPVLKRKKLLAGVPDKIESECYTFES